MRRTSWADFSVRGLWAHRDRRCSISSLLNDPRRLPRQREASETPLVDSGINNQGMTWIGSVTSQGDAAMNAPTARSTYNVNGAGIKIGIISDSFNRLGTMNAGIMSGNLPGAANPNGFTTPVSILKDDLRRQAAMKAAGWPS